MTIVISSLATLCREKCRDSRFNADCNCLSRHFDGIFGGIRKPDTHACAYPAYPDKMLG